LSSPLRGLLLRGREREERVGKRRGRKGGEERGERWEGGGRLAPQAKTCPPRTIFLAPALQRGQFDPKFHVQGITPTNHFCMDS